MYERSANVLERYFENLFGFNKQNNLRLNYENYRTTIEEIKEYQRIEEEEEKVISKFEEIASQIEEMQKEQTILHESNIQLEDERNSLFNDLSENTNTLDTKLQKIEIKIEENNEKFKEVREKYVKALVIFTERQKERNKYARIRRTAESNHINNIEKANKIFETLDVKDVNKIKKFIESNHEENNKEIINIMIKNGRNEKLPFDEKVIEKAVEARMNIAIKEAEMYVTVYERTKKLLNELNSENVKLARAEKVLRDTSVKLAFLDAKKEYIFSFLDNERMTTINGKRTHEKLMEEACKNFELDIDQIDKLYELIIRETTGKSTKKAYNELYNKTYLKDIQDKEKNFEEAVTNIKINMGTVINSNYWRIEGIKNIYNIFQEEVSEKFNKDLSEYKIEEIEEILPGLESEIYDEEQYEEYDEDYEDEEYDEDYEDEEYDEDYEDEYEDEYEDNEIKEDDYNKDTYKIQIEENDYDKEDDDDLLEEKINQIIKVSRKKSKKDKPKKQQNKEGLFGKLFKK